MKRRLLYFSFFIFILGCTIQASAEEKGNPYAVVSFTFDDAPRSVYTQAFPLLKAAGLHATVYLTTKVVGLDRYLDWEDIKALDSNGWEIAAHSYTHRDMTEMGDTEMMQEVEKSQSVFKQRGFKPVSFAAPLGAYGERELSVLKRTYSSNRAAWGNAGVNSYPEYDAYNLVSLGVTLNVSVEQIRKSVQIVKRNGGWLILQFHQIDDGHEVMAFSKGSIYTTKIFPEILKMILEEQIPVRTVRDIIENP